MVSDISLFAGCESVAAVRTILREQVQLEVDAMAALVQDADAFDVIELMRLRELGVVPKLHPVAARLPSRSWLPCCFLGDRGSRAHCRAKRPDPTWPSTSCISAPYA